MNLFFEWIIMFPWERNSWPLHSPCMLLTPSCLFSPKLFVENEACCLFVKTACPPYTEPRAGGRAALKQSNCHHSDKRGTYCLLEETPRSVHSDFQCNSLQIHLLRWAALFKLNKAKDTPSLVQLVIWVLCTKVNKSWLVSLWRHFFPILSNLKKNVNSNFPN